MTDTYLPRHLVQELEVALQHTRVVNLIGPRQAGKTTLVRDLFDRGNFISLDDAATLAALEADSYRRSRSSSSNSESAEASSSKWRACHAKNASTASITTRTHAGRLSTSRS